MTILDETTDLIRLYEHLCGESEVPREYHRWSFLSLLASRVEDRVWLEKHRGKKLTPLLFVFLNGPPALGKGIAIGNVLSLGMAASKVDDKIKVYNGPTSAAHLVDVLGGGMDSNREDACKLIANPKLWLVTDELANDIGHGKQAFDFVKLMTKLYTATGQPIDTGTRSHGSVRIINPNVNWLSGSTSEWLASCLSRESVEGGFTSRVAFVEATYQKVRYRRPYYPSDYEEVREYIVARLINLQYVKGVFVMTDEAETREDTWYMNRPEPDDFILYPSWKREQDFMLKLAMLLALSEWVGGSLVIQEYHVIEALKLSKSVSRSVSNVIDQASKNPQTKAIADVEEALKKIGKAQHTFFSRLMRKKGITPEQLKKIIDGLVDEGQVSLSRSTSNAKVYEWVKGVEV